MPLLPQTFELDKEGEACVCKTTRCKLVQVNGTLPHKFTGLFSPAVVDDLRCKISILIFQRLELETSGSN
jgi:hypothetical protein